MKKNIIQDLLNWGKVIFQCISILSIQFSLCSANGQNSVVRSFAVEKKIIGQGKDLYVRCDCIGMIGDKVFVVQVDGSPKFHIYSPDDLKLLRSFGLRGKGPNEFTGLTFFYNQVSKENGQFLFWVIDRDTRLFKQIAINEDLDKRGMQTNKQFHLSPETRIEKGIFYINDSLLIGTSSADNESFSSQGNGPFTKTRHFFKFNPQTKKTVWTVPYPPLKFETNRDCGNLYSDHPMLKPDGSKIACPSTFIDQIIIYNLDGAALTCILSPVKPPKLVKPDQLGWSNLEKFYYGFGYATDKYIYVVYQNETGESLLKQDNKSEIHVFDWNGKGICRYFTDFPLSNITVDEKNKTIYAGQAGITGDIVVFKIGTELTF